MSRNRKSPIVLDPVNTLEYFEDKAAHLQQLSAAGQVMKGLGAIVEWKQGQGWDGVFVGPEGEPIEAFVLTLRFFIKNNEPISLCNMRKLYSGLALSAGIFLYGSLAHGNDLAMRKTFQDLRKGAFFPLLQTYFVEAIRGFVIAINVLRKINQEALDEMHGNIQRHEASTV